ncbi:uncharacterized protein C12orf45 homolog [Amblyraja radiata]|uniref:uncharacterized protein C12orf45 homolog n=1 Tax=Amblyraja radiata TaxID=386614 RepID=UPI0014022EBE|nr:uncharacterized protein C12orf45 homolog [Amblyraja radiata]XP_055508725.1 uncharacterized protein C12orf45 homolog [Leucoraja erinacea]
MAAQQREREVSRSTELLGAGGQAGIEQKLLISGQHPRSPGPPNIVRLPRSQVLDRLQSFLPQMASANMELRKQMETADPSKFDIENVEHCPDKIIEMNVSLFEMDGESGAEDLTSDDSQSDTESYGEVTAENLKLPAPQPQRKGRIQVVSVDSSSDTD